MATKPKTPAAKSNLPKELEAAMHKALAALEGEKAGEAAKGFDELVEKAAASGHLGLQRVARGYAAAAHAREKKTTKAHPDPLIDLSLLLNDGESEVALERAEKATKAHGELAALHYLKATAMAQMGRYDESADALRKAMSINPDYGWTFRLEPDFARARTSPYFSALERPD
jgi:tetratricopeptide (TPR) repeat protein